MSKPTQTLDQALTDGESAIGPALELWLEREQSARSASPARRPGPYEVRISFGGIGEGRKPLLDLTWTAEQAVAAAVPGLLGLVRDKLTELQGPAPMGRLRVRVYHAGEATKTDKNFECDRSIAPGVDEFSGAGGDVVYLRQQNAQLHNSIVGMAAQTVLALQHTSTMAAEHAKVIGTLATARTASSASADSGGFWGIASLVAVAALWPVLQDAIGVQGATLPQMLDLFRAKVSIAIRGDKQRAAIDTELAPGVPTPPDGVAAPAQIEQVDDVVGEARNALHRLLNEPAFASAAAAELAAKPELKIQLLQAMA